MVCLRKPALAAYEVCIVPTTWKRQTLSSLAAASCPVATRGETSRAPTRLAMARSDHEIEPAAWVSTTTIPAANLETLKLSLRIALCLSGMAVQSASRDDTRFPWLTWAAWALIRGGRPPPHT